MPSTRPSADSVSSDHRPRSSGLMRPSGDTAVASMISSPAPDRANWPRWMMCQSVARPSSAEYWHMGAMTIRLRICSAPTRYGVNRALIDVPRWLARAGDRHDLVLDCRQQAAEVGGVVVAHAVDEERRDTVDAAADPAHEVLPNAG